MPFFAAVKPSMAIDSQGDQRLPVRRPVSDRQPHGREPGRAGAEHASTRATAPRTPDRIVITTNTDVNQSLLQVRAGQIDYDQYGLPPTAHDDLSRQYGVKKGGDGRYFVNTGINTIYLALNTSRPALGEGQPAQGDQPRDRPAVDAPRRRQVRRQADRPDPAAEHAGVPGRESLPDQGRQPRPRPRARERGEGRDHAPLHDEPDVDRAGADPQVQPRADRPQRDAEAAAVRRRTPDGGHPRLRLRRVPDRLVRRLPRPVRLHQRAARRAEHPGGEQLELLVPEQPQVQQADDRRLEALGRLPATTRTGSSTST